MHGLEGNCFCDGTKAFCCTCCTLIQTEKESIVLMRGGLVPSGEKLGLDSIVEEEYSDGSGNVKEEMVMSAPRADEAQVKSEESVQNTAEGKEKETRIG